MTQRTQNNHRPEFEVVDPTVGAVHYLEHGFPSPLVRWHYHDAYELHYIVASSGKVFVGDYIGEFQPGNLFLTGPRLPHNWISNCDVGQVHPLRDMAIQFNHATIEGAAALIPELREFLPLLKSARCGIQFPDSYDRAAHYMGAVRESSGASRLGYFFQFLHELAQCGNYKVLSTVQIESKFDEAALEKVNIVVNYVMQHYHENLTLSAAAELVGMNDSYFSRFFKKSTGNSFNEFVAQIRIGNACELLSGSELQISNICYEVGYNSIANFNRRFRERKQVTPREYRRQARQRLTRGGDKA